MNVSLRPFVRCLLALCAVAAAGCQATPRRVLTDADYPGELRPPEALGMDLLWQQRVTAHWGDGEERGFDAAVQKQGTKLTVIGLSPLGQAGFVLVQDPSGVSSQNHTDMHLPFPARFVLLDVQRTFFPWLPAMEAPADGERSGIVAGEQVVEIHAKGRLVERRFTRLSGQPAGSIVIRYEWGDEAAGRMAPRRAVLDNGWFGYRMTVDTHSEAVLPPEGS